MSCKPERILATEVLATYINGEKVWGRKWYFFLLWGISIHSFFSAMSPERDIAYQLYF
jgi:hypothetical protein